MVKKKRKIENGLQVSSRNIYLIITLKNKIILMVLILGFKIQNYLKTHRIISNGSNSFATPNWNLLFDH